MKVVEDKLPVSEPAGQYSTRSLIELRNRSTKNQGNLKQSTNNTVAVSAATAQGWLLFMQLRHI